jgi:hypothetical protein
MAIFKEHFKLELAKYNRGATPQPVSVNDMYGVLKSKGINVMEVPPTTMINELLEIEQHLSEWECNFINSIKNRDYTRLSVGQLRKLEQIYIKICQSPY